MAENLRLYSEPHGRDDRHDARRRCHQPTAQSVETDWGQQWQERITGCPARRADLIANDEAEIGEVVRRRRLKASATSVFAAGLPGLRRLVFRAQCTPAVRMAGDRHGDGGKARDFLRGRFEACYPFHPATLSVFQRSGARCRNSSKRGTLAMLAQWISWAAREHFDKAQQEPLITLGSAPLRCPEFRAVVLGQLGETRLDAAILADIASVPMSRAGARRRHPRGRFAISIGGRHRDPRVFGRPGRQSRASARCGLRWASRRSRPSVDNAAAA
jgi:hypothetical protein